MEQSPKVVTQRYFINHLKEIDEPVEVTVQLKGGGGVIKTIGFFFPGGSLHEVVDLLDRQNPKTGVAQ